MAFFALGVCTQSKAQTSRLAIKKPSSGTGVILDNETGGNTIFSIGGSEKMRLTSDGKLGIGTSSPEMTLDVRGYMLFEAGGDPVLYTGTGSTELNRYFQLINSPANASASGLKAGGMLVADAYNYANPGKNDLIVKGKVGIGTANSQEQLQVGSAGLVNIRIGKYAHLGETGNGLATVLGNNVKVSTTENVKMQFVNPTDGGQVIRLMYNEGISFHTAGGFITGQTITAGQNYAGYERMRIDLNGNVGIGTPTPTHKLEVAGNIKANNFPTTSDARFKKNIQSLSTDAVAKLSQVRGTSYQFRTKEFKAKNFSKGKKMGFIAQELIKVYPELVTKGADGYYSVNYTGLMPVLVEAIKDLRKKNGELKTHSQTLKAELADVKTRLATLEKLIIRQTNK